MTLALILDSAGFGEWFVLLAVVLIVVGPRKLPSTARKLGNYYAKFRRAAESFKRQLLDMETEITRTVDEAENSVSEAFKVEGSEPFTAPSAEQAQPTPSAESPVAQETEPLPPAEAVKEI